MHPRERLSRGCTFSFPSDFENLSGIFIAIVRCVGKLVPHQTLVDLTHVDILCQHLMTVLRQQTVCIGQPGQKRYAALRLDRGEQCSGILTETEDTRVLDIILCLECEQVFPVDSEKNMHQTPGDTGVGAVFCL